MLSLKLLGVKVQHNFSMNEHVDLLIADCSNSLYALNILLCHCKAVEGFTRFFGQKFFPGLLMSLQHGGVMPVHGMFCASIVFQIRPGN